ncbi:ankyrin and het domain-containing protein [Colletotrichum camelliae]|nr:ankyrin and het domain-containing protein [Colletotrichum camelliae]
MSEYKHKPLLHPDSFRLLLLQPSTFHDDELRGSLLDISLADCDYDLVDHYTALSYVWGSAEKLCYIRLDGNVLDITKSLNNALRDIRDTTRARRVWADALCIDQGNIPERNSQVSLMGRIYSGASSTIIYLGDLTPEAAEVFAAAPRESCNIASNLGGKDIDEIIELAAQDLLSRPWFKRVWVFQELVLSRDPWVQCGRTRVRWTDLCRLLLRRRGAKQKRLGLLGDMAAGRSRKDSFSLLDALKARRGLGATDPRDFVFANLGIVSDAPFEADYSKSTQWVFCQVGIELVNKLGKNGSRACRLGLPTGPMRLSGCLHYIENGIHKLNINNKSRNRPWRKTPHAFTGGNLPVVLGLPGSELDVVETTCGVVPLTPGDITAGESSDSDSRRRNIKQEARAGAWARFFHNLESPSTGEASENDAFLASFSRWESETYHPRQEPPSFHSHRYLEAGVDYVEEYFDHPGTTTALGGRRLAMTREGACCVVPAHTRKGDIIGCLMTNRLTVVLRRVQPPREQEITHAIVQALHGQEIYETEFDRYGGALEDYDGHGNPAGSYNTTLRWEVQKDVADVDIGHYIIVGACHFNRSGPCSKAYNGHVKVFALH